MLEQCKLPLFTYLITHSLTDSLSKKFSGGEWLKWKRLKNNCIPTRLVWSNFLFLEKPVKHLFKYLHWRWVYTNMLFLSGVWLIYCCITTNHVIYHFAGVETAMKCKWRCKFRFLESFLQPFINELFFTLVTEVKKPSSGLI